MDITTEKHVYAPVAVESERESYDTQETRLNDALLSKEDLEFSIPQSKPTRRRWLFALGGHGIMLLCYIVWTLALLLYQTPSLLNGTCAPGPTLVHSPAREAVIYETKEMNNSIYSTGEFKGDPRPEKTHAWRQYGRFQNMYASAEDLAAINRTSIPLVDGTGYLITLDVFHELHCLNIIREYIHADYYPTKESPQMRWIHVDHCLDTLRQIIMCHGDVSVVTFDWMVGQHDPFPNFNVNRECRNFDAIMDWAKAHQVTADQVVRPTDESKMLPGHSIED